MLGGKVWHEAETDADLPAVGDWVALDLGAEGDEVIIRERLPRVSRFSRKVPGKSAEEQVLSGIVGTMLGGFLLDRAGGLSAISCLLRGAGPSRSSC